MTNQVNIRELVLDILMEVTRGEAYSHLVIRSVLEKYQYLEKQERAFLTRVSEGTIEHMIELDYIINQFSKVKVNKMKPLIRNLMRMSVYQLKYMDSVPDSAACNEAVKLAKKRGFASLGGFVNGVLRNIGRNLSEVSYPDEGSNPIAAVSVRYSAPEWLVVQWSDAYGMEKTKEILGNFLLDAPVTIRANLEKTTREELIRILREEGVTVRPVQMEHHPELDYAFTIEGYDYLNALQSFRDGLFYVQDISSMLVAEYAGVKEGDNVIDVCAAPGGKSVHIAEKLKGTGHVEARDLTEAKAALIRENIERHRLKNLEACVCDATVFDAKAEGSADIVIADLPCSGLGILRKKTDVKYRMTVEQEEELAALQREILDVVCRYVKAGGTLVYSTCTIDRRENEDNVKWFLAHHPEFALEQMEQIFPGKEYGDGFFLCRLTLQKN